MRRGVISRGIDETFFGRMRGWFCLFVMLFLFHSTVQAQPVKTSPILLKADEMRHEETLDIVVAEGHVIASDGQKIVQADRLIYNKQSNTITATGNVILFSEDGSVVKTHYLELSDNFKEAFLQNAYLLTSEEEKVAARLIQKDDGKSQYQKAVYTPCLVCEKKEPLWQIKAEKVIYDQAVEEIFYENAVMELKGVPVFYLPRFSHPSPRVKRRSGFLTPILGSQTSLGMFTGVPYYFDLAPHKDLTVTPVVTTQTQPLLGTEYRHRFKDATMLLRGSLTYDRPVDGTIQSRKRRGQGHFVGATTIDLDEHWKFDGQALTSSSPGYLRRYSFLEGGHYWRENYLESSAHTEGFYDRNYVGVHGYHFQNLRSDVSSRAVPNVAPATSFSYFVPSNGDKGHVHMTGETLSVQRKVGTQMNRASSQVMWVVPYRTHHGSLGEFHTFMRADAYDIHRYQTVKNTRVDGGRGRGIPGASLSWKFPFFSVVRSTRLVVEPIVKGVVKPHGLNSFKIPNEDSRDFEFDARNLFSDNRFIGRDVVDDGQHVSYGVNVNAYGVYGVNLRGSLGQSYDFSKAQLFPDSSGIRKGSSDYLGRFKIIPNEWGSLEWRFMADNRSYHIKRNVVSVMAGPERLRLQVDYIYNDNAYFNSMVGEREQIAWKLSSKVTRDWSVFIGNRRELKNNPGSLESSIGARYEDECFHLIMEGMRTYYRGTSWVPATTVLFTLGFKNLGEVSTGRMGSLL